MKSFLTSLGVSFAMSLAAIWAIHNYNQYAASFDRVKQGLELNRTYAEYLPVLQAQINASTGSY